MVFPFVCKAITNTTVNLICDCSPSISDGTYGGYCDGDILCTDVNTGCDLPCYVGDLLWYIGQWRVETCSGSTVNYLFFPCFVYTLTRHIIVRVTTKTA